MSLNGGFELGEGSTCGYINCDCPFVEQVYGRKQSTDNNVEIKPEPKKFIEVETEVPIELSYQHKVAWDQLVNQKYYGHKQVPLDVSVSQEHKDASWHVHCCRRVPIKIRLYEDGSFETIVEHYMQHASPFKYQIGEVKDD